MSDQGHSPRWGTAFRAAALVAVVGVLGFASLRTSPTPPARDAERASLVRASLAEPEPSTSAGDAIRRAADEAATITDEVLNWAESTLERARAFIGEPTAEAKQAVADSTGMRLLNPTDTYGGILAWITIDDSTHTPDRLVVLVHGLDEPGDIWDELAPAIQSEGLSVARFDYPNDQGVADSTDLLAGALKQLCAAGTHRIDLVCHSMGGLVVRDLLTRADYYAGDTTRAADLPRVDRVITVGTPNYGAPFAPLRGLAEVRDQLSRLVDDDDITLGDLLRFSSDGNGEAGVDLAPGSDFLNKLNERPLPTGARWTIIVGRVASSDQIRALGDNKLSRAMGLDDDLDELVGMLVPISEDFGDGVVPESSALLPGVEDSVILEGNHRSLLRTVKLEQAIRGALGEETRTTPPAIPVIIDRLLEPTSSSDSSDR